MHVYGKTLIQLLARVLEKGWIKFWKNWKYNFEVGVDHTSITLRKPVYFKVCSKYDNGFILLTHLNKAFHHHKSVGEKQSHESKFLFWNLTSIFQGWVNDGDLHASRKTKCFQFYYFSKWQTILNTQDTMFVFVVTAMSTQLRNRPHCWYHVAESQPEIQNFIIRN